MYLLITSIFRVNIYAVKGKSQNRHPIPNQIWKLGKLLFILLMHSLSIASNI